MKTAEDLMILLADSRWTHKTEIVSHTAKREYDDEKGAASVRHSVTADTESRHPDGYVMICRRRYSYAAWSGCLKPSAPRVIFWKGPEGECGFPGDAENGLVPSAFMSGDITSQLEDFDGSSCPEIHGKKTENCRMMRVRRDYKPSFVAYVTGPSVFVHQKEEPALSCEWFVFCRTTDGGVAAEFRREWYHDSDDQSLSDAAYFGPYDTVKAMEWARMLPDDDELGQRAAQRLVSYIREVRAEAEAA